METIETENKIAETLTELRIARIHRDHLRRHRMPPAVMHTLDAKVLVAQRHLDRLLEQLGADNGQ